MSADSLEGRPGGRSAVIVEVPEVEGLVGHWPPTLDGATPPGIPPHVTILFPFVHPAAVDEAVLERLGTAVAQVPSFEVAFTAVERFPDTVWLAPVPEDGFLALVRAVTRAFPDLLPYEGRYPDVVPHLTLAQGDPPRIDAVEVALRRDLGARLPLPVRVRTVALFVESVRVWSRLREFGLS